MTTSEFRRTHRTVVERMRRAWEQEFTLESALEAAVAVEPLTTDERIDISTEYSAGRSGTTRPGSLRRGCCRMRSSVLTASPRMLQPAISFIVYGNSLPEPQ